MTKKTILIITILLILSFPFVALGSYITFRLTTDFYSILFNKEHSYEITFTFQDIEKKCLPNDNDVVGIENTPLTNEPKQPHIVERAYRRLFGFLQRKLKLSEPRWQTYIFNYDFKDHPALENRAVQNITLEVPTYIHYRAIPYELSCLSYDGKEYINFKKFAPQIINHNYRSPAVHIVPFQCQTPKGQFRFKLQTEENTKTIYKETLKTTLRATLWDTDSSYPHNSTLDFYAPSKSYTAGQTIYFHGHSHDSDNFALINIFHIGATVEHFDTIDNISLKPQNLNAYSYRDGVRWDKVAEFKIPDYYPSGYYLAELSQNETIRHFPFIVRPKVNDQKAPMAIIAATNTWDAYNSWGGGSFYSNIIGKECLNTDYARIISTVKPYYDSNHMNLFDEPKATSHLFTGEKTIPQWLTQNGYDFDAYTSNDLHVDNSFLKNYKIIVLPPHPEYYSDTMYTALEDFVKNGGSIIYLGGNALYYRTAISGTHMEKHEDGRIFDLENSSGGMWAFNQGRSPAQLLGVEYDARDYNTYMPYEVLEASHPYFNGTGLKNGDVFADDASGLEMDVIVEASPKNLTLLAKGTNINGYGANMVVFDTPYGGKVFSVGSISFFYGLLHDDIMQQFTRNVFDDFLRTNKNQ